MGIRVGLSGSEGFDGSQLLRSDFALRVLMAKGLVKNSTVYVRVGVARAVGLEVFY